MKTKAICRVCDVTLNNENWSPSRQKKNSHICNSCRNKQMHQWRKANPEKIKAIWARANRKRGQLPMSKNKECSAFLGVHIAEGVLSQAFKDIQRMPYGYPGYDLICNQKKMIDVKSSCKRKTWGGWEFNIKYNTIADYFLCLAFDNREDLNPLHAWLLPGSKFNHFKSIGISPSTIHKWDTYRLDISKISQCCDAMR